MSVVHAKPEAHAPATGPVDRDVTHWPVAPHQPQLLTGVQPAQEVYRLHGSALPASGVVVPASGTVCTPDQSPFEPGSG